MKHWFKILDDEGQSCHGGEFTWSLPTRDLDGNWIPGDWHEDEIAVVLCKSGFHITDDPLAWIHEHDQVVYECEIAEDAVQTKYDSRYCKKAVSKLRLTKPFSGAVQAKQENSRHKERWFLDGKTHRDNDLPAVIFVNGDQQWSQNGKLHRDNDLPAVIFVNGGRSWWLNGKLHRDNDLPAIIEADGTQEWYQDGQYYREDDQPVVVGADGRKEWWKDEVFMKKSEQS